MTPDDVVEAMARGIATALGHRWETLSNLARAGMCDIARAAIRAVHERGGLVVARMPENATHGPALNQLMGDASAWVGGYNAALAAVRAAAVEVGTPATEARDE